MNDFVDNAMNFINENTTLLIIICVFLIFVLILYLINSSIQTKKLEKVKLQSSISNNENKEVVETKTEIIETKTNEVSEEKPIIENIEVEEPIEKEEFIPVEETSKIDIEPVEEKKENYVNSINVEPEVNDILLKDFTNNENIVSVENTIEEPEEITLNPIEKIDNIETEIEVKKPASIYKNDKTISDIFSKKDEVSNSTIDSTEIDRIISKINSLNAELSKDSTLDETQDFSNMF